MNVIVSENMDGSVAITTMAPTFMAAEVAKGKTETQVLIEHQSRLEGEGHTVVGQVDPAVLPDNDGSAMEDVLDEDTLSINKTPYADQKRCFRSQWVWNGTAVVEDVTRVHTEKARRAKMVRNRILELSDKDEFRLNGQALTRLRIWRRALRDLGTAIDADPDNINWPLAP